MTCTVFAETVLVVTMFAPRVTVMSATWFVVLATATAK